MAGRLRPMAGGRRRIALLVSFAMAATFGPGLAAAHGVTTSRFDAPLPLWLLLVGAGGTVAATAVLIAVGDRSERQRGAERSRIAVPDALVRWGRPLLCGSFLLAVVTVLFDGMVGRQVAAENVATVFAWPIWLHGLALLAMVLGNHWPTLSPWRTLYRALSSLEGRRFSLLDGDGERLGTWPAVIGFVLLFGVVENLTVIPRSPRLTAVLVAAYAAAMVVGSVLLGSAWFRRADPLAVLYRLFGRVSPIAWSTADDEGTESVGDERGRGRGDDVEYDGGSRSRGRTLSLRWPWEGCLRPVADRSLVVFVVAMVYTVSFDGANDLRAFRTVRFTVREWLGTGPETSVLLYVVGLVAFVGVFLVAILLVERLGAGEWGGRTTTENGGDWLSAAKALAPTVLPIAAAYEGAHVYPYVLDNVGQFPAVVADLFGATVGAVTPLAWLSLPAFWTSQVALIVVGHLVAVVAAHQVTRERYPTARAATIAHLPLVALMVGYTALSLWIISAPVVA